MVGWFTRFKSPTVYTILSGVKELFERSVLDGSRAGVYRWVLEAAGAPRCCATVSGRFAGTVARKCGTDERVSVRAASVLVVAGVRAVFGLDAFTRCAARNACNAVDGSVTTPC